MAKRKLYGAALAAHNKKIGARSTKSTALVRRSTAMTAPKTKTRTKYIKVRVKRRAGSGGGAGSVGNGISGAIATLKRDAWDYGAAGGYGYLTGNDSLDAVELRKKTLDKLDFAVSAKLGKPLSHGLIFLVGAALMPRGGGLLGFVRKAAGHLSHAALMRASHNFGVAGGNTATFAAMSGDSDELQSGVIDVDAEER